MSDDIERKIGAQLARIRKERGLSQAELAALLNVATETVSRLERGVSIPSVKTLEAIGNVLNIHLRDIFDFEYTPKSKVAAVEKETAKLIAFLKTKRIADIKMCYRILRNVLGEIERNYQPKKK